MADKGFNAMWGLIVVVGVVLCVGLPSCEEDPNISGTIVKQSAQNIQGEAVESASNAERGRPPSDERVKARLAMVEHIETSYGLADTRVSQAMKDVPRHWFVPLRVRPMAYKDTPLPIGFGQTISQPFMVAFMTSVLNLDEDTKVLEIGTGSGYQAAVLYEFTPHVYTIEIVEELADRTIGIFAERGYDGIKTKIGDGYKGWPEYAPFDAIIVTCAPDHIPQPLVDQLAVGGRIVIPVGSQQGSQELVLVSKGANGELTQKSLMPVRFVPLTRDDE